MEIAGIEITHPDKIIFPQAKLTKEDVARFYDKISDFLLPHLKDRPLTLHRFPEGIGSEGFYQKNIPDYFPDFIPRIEVSTQTGMNIQTYCNSKKELLYLVNQNTISFHPWLSKKDHPEKPDKVVFDLDPSENDFEEVKKAAKIIRQFLLQEKEIDPKLMTTGKNGLHVWWSITPDRTFDEQREDIKEMALTLEKNHPEIFTTELKKSKRGKKIFIDYLRNAYAQTSVAPFSLRAHESAGVATPLEWDELNRLPSASHFNFQNIFRRLGQKK